MKACIRISVISCLWLAASSCTVAVAGNSVPPPSSDADAPWVWVVPRLTVEDNLEMGAFFRKDPTPSREIPPMCSNCFQYWRNVANN